MKEFRGLLKTRAEFHRTILKNKISIDCTACTAQSGIRNAQKKPKTKQNKIKQKQNKNKNKNKAKQIKKLRICKNRKSDATASAVLKLAKINNICQNCQNL